MAYRREHRAEDSEAEADFSPPSLEYIRSLPSQSFNVGLCKSVCRAHLRGRVAALRLITRDLWRHHRNGQGGTDWNRRYSYSEQYNRRVERTMGDIYVLSSKWTSP